jgi:enterochelin esterase-like enzyme
MRKIAFAVACLASVAFGQVKTEAPPVVAGAKPVVVQRVQIHGKTLEGNLEGSADTREALVFLPPGYEKNPRRRYAVVYALHGFFIGAEQWSKEIHAPQTIEGAFALGAKDMIVVLPDTKTLHNGSFYSSSVTTGDFEHFIARDVVSYIDAHFRTLPARESRGLVGHSMGGYGATRIGMRHADVFGSLYIMSPCCLAPFPPPNAEMAATLEAVKSPDELAKLPFFTRAMFATASAFSPNPDNPPFFLDLPVKDGQPRPDVIDKWKANSPLIFLDQYVGELRRYHGIALDCGNKDGLLADTRRLHEAMKRYGIANTFEEYEGDHTNKLGDRFQNHVLPFFSRNLRLGDAK